MDAARLRIASPVNLAGCSLGDVRRRRDPALAA